jgi:phosphoribosylanthranilate isomerase
MTRIKICCIATPDEARRAVALGASALGLVSEMPSGPGPIPEERIAEIAAGIPPGVASFLLTSLQDVDAVIAQQRRCRVNTIQLCDRLLRGSHRELAGALPGVRIVQVVHVTGEAAAEEARALAGQVDALLLDSGNPALRTKELGGTGRIHDWEISTRIRREAGVPVFLAGGLTPENVARAIRTVGPFAVDVCSGVRAGGQLDETRLRAFIEAVRRVDEEIAAGR